MKVLIKSKKKVTRVIPVEVYTKDGAEPVAILHGDYDALRELSRDGYNYSGVDTLKVTTPLDKFVAAGKVEPAYEEEE